MKLILATSNQHKAEEFKVLFDKEVIEILAAKESIDVEETGNNFIDNSFIKAKAYYDQYKTPVMADDSGLIVQGLPEDLGVKTARFGGPDLSAKERCELLLKKLNGRSELDREAYFICCLCFYLSPSEIFFFEGRVYGLIGEEYRGEHGFGYDPVFLPKELKTGQTLAEVPEWKDQNSHRALACQYAQKFFKERVCQKGQNPL